MTEEQLPSSRCAHCHLCHDNHSKPRRCRRSVPPNECQLLHDSGRLGRCKCAHRSWRLSSGTTIDIYRVIRPCFASLLSTSAYGSGIDGAKSVVHYGLDALRVLLCSASPPQASCSDLPILIDDLLSHRFDLCKQLRQSTSQQSIFVAACLHRGISYFAVMTSTPATPEKL